MIATLRHRNFALLWTAGLVSLVGDWAFYAAMPIFVLDRTGSASWSGLVWAAIVLPGIVVGPVAGVFVDRWDRRSIMFWGNIAQTAAAAVLLLAGESLGVWVAMAVLLVQACLYAIYSPAESALLPTVVDDAHLATANALNSLNDNIARVAGPLAGAILYAWLGIRGIALGNMISFAGAALLVGLVSVAAKPRPDEGVEASISGQIWRPMRAGAATVWRTPSLRAVFAIIGLVALADGPLTAMLAPFIRETLDRSAADFGAFLSWRGVAGILGGLVIARIAHRYREERLLVACLFGLGVEIAAFAIIQDYLITIVLMMLAGPAIVGMSATIRTMLQRQTEDAIRGRVVAFEVAVWGLVFLASTVVASAAAAFVSPETIVFASGVLYLIAGVGAVLLLLPAARGATPPVPAPDETPARIG